MSIILEIVSIRRIYDLDNRFDLLRLKNDLKAYGFFEVQGNAQFEEYFTRVITDEELKLFMEAVRWWDYNRQPKEEHKSN